TSFPTSRHRERETLLRDEVRRRKTVTARWTISARALAQRQGDPDAPRHRLGENDGLGRRRKAEPTAQPGRRVNHPGSSRRSPSPQHPQDHVLFLAGDRRLPVKRNNEPKRTRTYPSWLRLRTSTCSVEVSHW